MQWLYIISAVVSLIVGLWFLWEKLPDAWVRRLPNWLKIAGDRVVTIGRRPSTQIKILSILKDGPADYHRISRELCLLHGSEVRPATIQNHLETLMSKGLVILVDQDRYSLTGDR